MGSGGVGTCAWQGGMVKKRKKKLYITICTSYLGLFFIFGIKTGILRIFFFFLKKDNILKVLLTHVNIPHIMAL